MGPSADNLPIEGGFIVWDVFCCKTKWNSGWISQTPWPKVKQGFLQMLGKYQLLNIPIGIGIEFVLKIATNLIITNGIELLKTWIDQPNLGIGIQGWYFASIW